MKVPQAFLDAAYASYLNREKETLVKTYATEDMNTIRLMLYPFADNSEDREQVWPLLPNQFARDRGILYTLLSDYSFIATVALDTSEIKNITLELKV
jgi:hypothetical protein